MATLSALDLAKLAYPFRRADHEFLQGYVYIQEEAIAERLDTVDLCWSHAIDEMKDYGDSIVIRSTMTIKGVSRSNTGGNPVQRDKEEKVNTNGKYVGTGKYETLPLYTQADNGVNSHKSAATDAMKRCARMFGIGRYLLSAPKVSGENTTKFDEWLAEEHKQAKARHDALTGKVIDTATGEITQSPETTPPAPPPPIGAQQPPPSHSAPQTGNAGQERPTLPNGLRASTPSGKPDGDGSEDEPLFPPELPGAKVVTLDNGRQVHTRTEPVPGRDVSGFPLIGGGKIKMIELLNKALAEKLVREKNHFSNQIDKCIEEGLISDPATVTADQVLEAMRAHLAAKDLQREGVGAR